VPDDSDRTTTNRIRLSVKKGEPKQGKAKQSMTPYSKGIRRRILAKKNEGGNEHQPE